MSLFNLWFLWFNSPLGPPVASPLEPLPPPVRATAGLNDDDDGGGGNSAVVAGYYWRQDPAEEAPKGEPFRSLVLMHKLVG